MKLLPRVLSWLITFLVPIALIFLGVRLMLTHAFLEVEYHMPGFPADSYGFTTADRLHWSRLAVDYLVNDASISFLGNQVFPDGSPLYNERELSHMLDVKNVVKPALGVGYAVLAVLLGLTAWARFGGWWNQSLRGLKRGGWLTVGLVAVLAIFGSVSFWQFFTLFLDLRVFRYAYPSVPAAVLGICLPVRRDHCGRRRPGVGAGAEAESGLRGYKG
jgi:hypothetical protein